jgi:hypothetical protein
LGWSKKNRGEELGPDQFVTPLSHKIFQNLYGITIQTV